MTNVEVELIATRHRVTMTMEQFRALKRNDHHAADPIWSLLTKEPHCARDVEYDGISMSIEFTIPSNVFNTRERLEAAINAIKARIDGKDVTL